MERYSVKELRQKEMMMHSKCSCMWMTPDLTLVR